MELVPRSFLVQPRNAGIPGGVIPDPDASPFFFPGGELPAAEAVFREAVPETAFLAVPEHVANEAKQARFADLEAFATEFEQVKILG